LRISPHNDRTNSSTDPNLTVGERGQLPRGGKLYGVDGAENF